MNGPFIEDMDILYFVLPDFTLFNCLRFQYIVISSLIILVSFFQFSITLNFFQTNEVALGYEPEINLDRRTFFILESSWCRSNQLAFPLRRT